MLPLPLVQEIDRLLQEGKLSQCKIAARLGVSRGTVGAISNGRRGLHGKEPRADDDGPLVPMAPPERCDCCGFMVYMPCLICRAREYRLRQAALMAVGVNLAARPATSRTKTCRTGTPRPSFPVSRPAMRARRARVA